MLKLELNFDKKDIEVEINGKVYGFDMTEEKVQAMSGLQDKANDINIENEENYLFEIEDAIDMIYGEGTIDSIFGIHETSRATLLEILKITIQALENYGREFGVETGEIKKEKAPMNRAQRRARRRYKK